MKWISIKDKKPNARKKLSAVLAYVVGGQIDIIHYDKRVKGWRDYYYNQVITDDILYWQPLPEPPK